MDLIKQEDFVHDGRMFRAKFYEDDNQQAPWVRNDGHGPVTEFRHGYRNKAAREWVLVQAHGYARYYNAKAAQAKALAENWGLTPIHLEKLGPTPTRRQIAAEAVRLDYEHLRGWCTDEWSYIGISVHALAQEEDEEPYEVGPPFSFAIWGIESNATEHHMEVMRDLASQIIKAT